MHAQNLHPNPVLLAVELMPVAEPQPPPPTPPPDPILKVSVQVTVSEKVWVILNVRLQGAVAVKTEVIVAILVFPPTVMVFVPPSAVISVEVSKLSMY